MDYPVALSTQLKQHLRSLRRMKDDDGWIHTLLEEAENERMHLMTFMHIARPSAFERLLVLLAQGIFYNCFFLLYLISARTAHRVTGQPPWQRWSVCQGGANLKRFGNPKKESVSTRFGTTS